MTSLCCSIRASSWVSFNLRTWVQQCNDDDDGNDDDNDGNDDDNDGNDEIDVSPHQENGISPRFGRTHPPSLRSTGKAPPEMETMIKWSSCWSTPFKALSIKVVGYVALNGFWAILPFQVQDLTAQIDSLKLLWSWPHLLKMSKLRHHRKLRDYLGIFLNRINN